MFYEIMHRESCVAQLSTTGECRVCLAFRPGVSAFPLHSAVECSCITNETARWAVSFLFYRRFCGRGMPSTSAMPTASATAILKVEMPFASASALSP